MVQIPGGPSGGVNGPFADPEDGLTLGANRGRSRARSLASGYRTKRRIGGSNFGKGRSKI